MLVMTVSLRMGRPFVSWAAGTVCAVKRNTSGKSPAVIFPQKRTSILIGHGISLNIGLKRNKLSIWRAKLGGIERPHGAIGSFAGCLFIFMKANKKAET
jgi:hypothetical protein